MSCSRHEWKWIRFETGYTRGGKPQEYDIFRCRCCGKIKQVKADPFG